MDTLEALPKGMQIQEKPMKRSSKRTDAVTKVTKLILKPRNHIQSPKTKLVATSYTSKTFSDDRLLLQNAESFCIKKYDRRKSPVKNICRSTSMANNKSSNVHQISTDLKTEEDGKKNTDNMTGENNQSIIDAIEFRYEQKSILMTKELNKDSRVFTRTSQNRTNEKYDAMFKSSPPVKSAKPSVINTLKCQKKTYDPIKARRYMREQQIKRKEILMDKILEKERKNEIRQRLINLQKNSMEIVGKNVERARIGPAGTGSKLSRNVEYGPDAMLEPKKHQNKENEPIDLCANSVDKNDRQNIGILRRFENQQDPISTATKLRPEHSSPSDEPHQDLPLCTPHQLPLELELKAPDTMKLQSSLLLPNNMPNNQEENPNDISFWLKPSPIQPYPYNFIMAVRKKLEAISHPVAMKSRANADSFALVSSKSTEHTIQNETEISPTNDMQIESNTSKPMLIATQSDDHQSKNTQNTLSISSGILSIASPEKHAPIVSENNTFSPLSTDAVDGMQIAVKNRDTESKRTLADIMSKKAYIESHVEFNRGDDIDTSYQSGTTGRSQSDIQKMLSDFNESLSQVIKVNKKLHDALSKPPTIETSSNSYSDDFDDDNTKSTATYSQTITQKPSDTDASRSLGTKNSEQTSVSTMDRSITNSHSLVKSGVEEVVTEIMAEELSETTEAIQRTTGTTPEKNRIASFEQHFSNDGEMLNTSIGSDIFAVFNRTSVHNTSTWSEANISYSSLGMFERLIQTETQKLKHLSSLLKMREKSVIDRFKGQIAWLELKKMKLKERGQLDEIGVIKKKQRALLLRLQKDRREIHRLMELHKERPRNATNVQYKISHVSTNMRIRRTSLSGETDNKNNQAVRAIELQPGDGLEKILQVRENDLRRRREYVEKLLQWHRQLDDEEHEVGEMEKVLEFCCRKSSINQRNSSRRSNHSPAHTSKHLQSEQSDDDGVPEQIQQIEDSLKTLQNMSLHAKGNNEATVVGKYLNRLWKRLTGQSEEIYRPTHQYVLNRKDLEILYENAKLVVLKRFDTQQALFNASTMTSIETSNEPSSQKEENQEIVSVSDDVQLKTDNVVVPDLNLDFSSEPSAKENGTTVNNDGYYFENSKLPLVDVDNVHIQLDQNRMSETVENDDIYSDITEDSLNLNMSKPVSTIHAALASSNITAAKQNDYSDQLIDDISFPNLDITSMTSVTEYVEGEETSKQTITLQSDNKYLSDDFESVKTSDKTTILSDNPTNSEQNETITVEIRKDIISNTDSVSNCIGNVEETSIVMSRSPSPRSSSSSSISKELEQRLIDIDDSLKDLRSTISRSPVLEMADNSKDNIISETNHTSDELLSSTSNTLASDVQITASNSLVSDETKIADKAPLTSICSLKMRGKKIVDITEVYPKLETDTTTETMKFAQPTLTPKGPEIKYCDTIPNKPPPPYPADRPHIVPPVLPSDERMREIIHQQIQQIYDISKAKSENVVANATFIMSPKTQFNAEQQSSSELASPTDQLHSYNLYERIFVNICEEIMEEMQQQESNHRTHAYKQPLAFFNPPNRLNCLKEFVVKRIQKLLGRQNHSIQPQISYMIAKNRRKRDLVDEILIQELLEDEQKWTNFDVEEEEIQNGDIEEDSFNITQS